MQPYSQARNAQYPHHIGHCHDPDAKQQLFIPQESIFGIKNALPPTDHVFAQQSLVDVSPLPSLVIASFAGILDNQPVKCKEIMLFLHEYLLHLFLIAAHLGRILSYTFIML